MIRDQTVADVVGVNDGFHHWSGVGVAILDVWTDERDVGTAQRHDDSVVVWSEQFH